MRGVRVSFTSSPTKGSSHLAQGDEFGVAAEAGGSPFGEFDFGFDFGAEPNVVGHFFGGDAFAKVA